jgi:hypothetical protein
VVLPCTAGHLIFLRQKTPPFRAGDEGRSSSPCATLPAYRRACGNRRLWSGADNQGPNERVSRSQRFAFGRACLVRCVQPRNPLPLGRGRGQRGVCCCWVARDAFVVYGYRKTHAGTARRPRSGARRKADADRGAFSGTAGSTHPPRGGVVGPSYSRRTRMVVPPRARVPVWVAWRSSRSCRTCAKTLYVVACPHVQTSA